MDMLVTNTYSSMCDVPIRLALLRNTPLHRFTTKTESSDPLCVRKPDAEDQTRLLG